MTSLEDEQPRKSAETHQGADVHLRRPWSGSKQPARPQTLDAPHSDKDKLARGAQGGRGEPVREFFMSNMSTRARPRMLVRRHGRALGPGSAAGERSTRHSLASSSTLAKDLAAKGRES